MLDYWSGFILMKAAPTPALLFEKNCWTGVLISTNLKCELWSGRSVLLGQGEGQSGVSLLHR
jgi:hypothetical protein